MRDTISADEYLNLILDLNNAANRVDTSKKVFELFKVINMTTCNIDTLTQYRLLNIYKKDTEIYTRQYKHMCDWGDKSNDYFGSVSDVLRKVHGMLASINENTNFIKLVQKKGMKLEDMFNVKRDLSNSKSIVIKKEEKNTEPEPEPIHPDQGSFDFGRATQLTFAF